MAAHLVRDEGVAGSNPATPTIFLKALIAYGARYGERNALALAMTVKATWHVKLTRRDHSWTAFTGDVIDTRDYHPQLEAIRFQTTLSCF
jgi:hypothetical protein